MRSLAPRGVCDYCGNQRLLRKVFFVGPTRHEYRVCRRCRSILLGRRRPTKEEGNDWFNTALHRVIGPRIKAARRELGYGRAKTPTAKPATP